MVSANYVKNENLIKLKELSDKLCSVDYKENIKEEMCYKEVVGEISDVIEDSEEILFEEQNSDNKLKCYETMCSRLKLIVNKFKIR